MRWQGNLGWARRSVAYRLVFIVNNNMFLLSLFGPGNGSPSATNVVVVLLGVVVIRFSKY